VPGDINPRGTRLVPFSSLDGSLMILLVSFALALSSAPPQGAAGVVPDSVSCAACSRLGSPGGDSLRVIAPIDTNGAKLQVDSISSLFGDTIKPRQRPKAIELSDWYYRRLEIHRWGSYVVFPVFVAQYVAGNRIFPDPTNAPEWAKTGHRVGATILAGVFTSNTITGVWNLWDTRHVADRRALRYVHAVSMLTADAAFTYAGSVLATQAQNSLQKRREHRTVALSAMGVTAASALMMKILNNRPSQ
jgi:hypothetical protein